MKKFDYMYPLLGGVEGTCWKTEEQLKDGKLSTYVAEPANWRQISASNRLKWFKVYEAWPVKFIISSYAIMNFIYVIACQSRLVLYIFFFHKFYPLILINLVTSLVLNSKRCGLSEEDSSIVRNKTIWIKSLVLKFRGWNVNCYFFDFINNIHFNIRIDKASCVNNLTRI